MAQDTDHFRWYWLISAEPLMAVFFAINGAVMVAVENQHTVQRVFWWTWVVWVIAAMVSLFLYRRHGSAIAATPLNFRIAFVIITALEVIGAMALSHMMTPEL